MSRLSLKERKAIRDCVARLQEETGADAIVIALTRHSSKGTETLAVPYGNAHTCRGVAEYLYGVICEGADDLEPEPEEE